MDARAEVREFLVSRRARVNPEDVGLPAGGNRRVAGLRREELATLAGVSISYYTRLERGDATGVSDSVLDAIGRILLLDEPERTHLRELLAAASGERPQPGRRRATSVVRLRPALQSVLDAITDAPAIVHNPRMDIIGANLLARGLYADLYRAEPDPPNLARYMFLRASTMPDWPEWDMAADQLVGILRAAAGHDPYDTGLSALIGELSTRSEDFRTRWARHNVRKHMNGLAYFRHEAVGEITLGYESFELAAEPGLALKVYTPEPNSPSADALRLLAAWQATRDGDAAQHAASDAAQKDHS